MPRGAKKRVKILFRCGESEHGLSLSVRDVRLLDGDYFLGSRIQYRVLFGLNFVRGLQPPPIGEVILTRNRALLVEELKQLLMCLEDQRHLISYSYSFEFVNKPVDAPTTTFKVDGLWGHISATPSGYCDVVLMEDAPTGRGRIAQIIDMRVKKELQTDNHGVLKVTRRKTEVGWFDELPTLIHWLKEQASREVDVLLAPP